MDDHDKVQLHIDAAEEEGHEISDACARVIASWWASGMGVGQSFATTGAVTTPSDDVYGDLTDNGRLYTSASPDDKRALNWLGTYLLNREDRGPVEGWSGLWL